MKAKTGDLFLHKGRSFLSTLIMLPVEARYSHISMFVDHPEYGPCILESTSQSDVPDVITGKLISGVQLSPFEKRINGYDGEVDYRPIIGTRTAEQLQSMLDFIKVHHGKPYEQSNWELVNAEIDGILPWHVNKPDPTSLFCSETAAMALRNMDILTKIKGIDLPANEFTPSDFAGELNLNEGFTLGKIVKL